MSKDDAYSMILCLDGWYLTNAVGIADTEMNYVNNIAAATGGDAAAGTEVGTAVNAGMKCAGKNSLRLYIPYTLSLPCWLQDLSRQSKTGLESGSQLYYLCRWLVYGHDLQALCSKLWQMFHQVR